MNTAQFSRTQILIGGDGLNKLAMRRIAVIGLGGVGSAAAEALARAGIGRFLLVDFDSIKPSNLNRQLIALHSTLGKQKTEVTRQRLLDINPAADIEIRSEFCAQENRHEIIRDVDFIIDAIDSLGPKIGLLEYAVRNSFRVISVMGAGNRLDPSYIHIATLSKSWNCPLAKRVRKFLKRRGIEQDIPVVFSSEKPVRAESEELPEGEDTKVIRGRERQVIGSISYLPPIMGMMAASYVINSILKH